MLLYQSRWFAAMSLANEGIFWDQKMTVLIQELQEAGMEMELEKYVTCPERVVIKTRHKSIKVEINLTSMKKMICCALELHGFKNDGEIYVSHDGTWERRRLSVSLPSIVTSKLVEDVLSNINEYFL